MNIIDRASNYVNRITDSEETQIILGLLTLINDLEVGIREQTRNDINARSKYESRIQELERLHECLEDDLK